MSQIANGRSARVDRPGPDEERVSTRLGAYLKRLREGYGYTLRRVEEKSTQIGDPIDNSQLSRFEKGKALPSFDKLRTLARVFNVSVQNFSDFLDLEEFEASRPETNDYDEALRLGAAAYAHGDHGGAFVAFERALEIAKESGDSAERIAEARWRVAAALKGLGKLAMSEHELREILKLRDAVSRRIRIRALLHLCFAYRELSDLYIAQVLARESLDLAVEDGDLGVQAAVLNTLGNICEHDDPVRGLAYYERAAVILERLGTQEEMRLTVLCNLGGCLARTHRFEQGVTRLQEAHSRSRALGFRRVAALSLTRLAEAQLGRGAHDAAMKALSDSDALASDAVQPYEDILFLNAFHRWKLSREEGQGTREKIAFGRLRHLRSRLERRFPEVDDFDSYVEKTRRTPS
jgi:transcriptional regulator with XRE-family HTH domain